MSAQFHLGTCWHFARPKYAEDETRYIELRLLASIDPRTSCFGEIISMLVSLVCAIQGRVTESVGREDATDLLADLRHGGFEHYLPERLLNYGDWQQMTVWTDGWSMDRSMAAE